MCSEETDEECLPIFVYGTLRPGQSKYQLLRGKTRSEQRAILEGACLVSLNSYPMALSLDNLPPYLNRDAIINTNVYGDLVIPHERHCDRLLAQLDSYENYDPSYPEGSLYWRELREVTVLEPEPHRVAAWVYMGNPRFVAPEYPLIESGDWAKYCEERLRKRRLYRMSFCSG